MYGNMNRANNALTDTFAVTIALTLNWSIVFVLSVRTSGITLNITVVAATNIGCR